MCRRKDRATPSPRVAFGCVVVALAALLGGCSQVHRNEAKYTTDFLMRAGFQVAPEDASSKRRLTAMTPLRLVREEKDGRTMFFYADPYACRCVYVGDETAYAQYRRLVEAQFLDAITSVPIE